MIYLLLSILCSTCLFVTFKWYEKFQIDSFQAIVFNYITAALCGLIASFATFSFSVLIQKTWLWNACVIGAAFIICIYLLSLSIVKIGISITTVVNKMSVLVPVLFAFWYYHEIISVFKVVGIGLGILSIYFITYRNESKKIEHKYLYLPIALFITGGICDTYIKYTQQTYLSASDHSLFSFVLFSTAAVFGLIIFIIRIIYFKSSLNFKSIIGGILLGIPNYGSIFFLVRALDNGLGKSALIFSLNNVGVVAVSSLLAFMVFKEKFNGLNWLGILISIISILFISLS